MRSRSYLLSILMIVLAWNSVDRLALGLVLQDIKLDLRLTDTQLGFLTGMAFAIFYSLMGIPIARWADRGNRIAIISITTAVWSAAVCLCGLAGSFLQLLLIRIGVAVGEAGCIPPAHSLIADHFSRCERPRAVARYMLGGPISAVIGFFLAGWLNELYGWRMTFAILGIPGLAVATLAWLTLRDPRVNPSPPAMAQTATAQPSMREVFATLWANATFRHLLLCFSVKSFFTYGIAKWQPAFFIRTHGMETGELGTWLAVIYGAGGLLGTWLGGEWASRRAANNERLQLSAMAILYCAFAVLFACVYLSPDRYFAFGFLSLAVAGMTLVSGPLFATLQTLVPDHMRAVSIAVIYLFANLFGMGLGPLVVGVMSDAFRPWAGEESLRYGLLAMSPAYLWGAWHLWRASRTVTRELPIRESVLCKSES